MSEKGQRVRQAERTRRRILEIALRMFRERGLEGTTMRGIAAEAGVSVSNTYYYFASKEHLIQAYYGRSHAEHLAACAGALEEERDLKQRLLAVCRTKIESAAPYHRFAGQLFRSAGDPSSPLSPFSAESAPVRREATELMALVLEGSATRVPPELARELPNLLWLYLMAIILYWIHDDSPGCARTYKLIDHTVEIIVRLINLSSLALMRPLVRAALELTRDLRALSEPPSAGLPAKA